VTRRLSAFGYYARQVPRVLLGLGPLSTVASLFLGRTRGAPVIAVRPGGPKFRVRTAMDAWVVAETCLDRPYERVVSLEGCRTIVDVGAGLGDFAVHAARVCPNALVLAYEPSPESFRLLEENLRLNGCRNVVARPWAVVGSPGRCHLDVGRGTAVQHALAAESATTIEVPAMTLEALFREHQVALCDFLKIDVEGAEFEILMNAPEETLMKIDRLALEYHLRSPGPTVDDLRDFLTARGFAVTVHPSPVHRHLGYLHAVKRSPASGDAEAGRIRRECGAAESPVSRPNASVRTHRG
jgi:FkbM family methyltransferase